MFNHDTMRASDRAVNPRNAQMPLREPFRQYYILNHMVLLQRIASLFWSSGVGDDIAALRQSRRSEEKAEHPLYFARLHERDSFWRV